ncbi:hypothetical protein GCM10027612_41230 [Microbispora bryophytorum subsp. camponoti]
MSDADFTPLRVTQVAYGRDIDLAIREWARANGHPISDCGRVGHGLVEAFFAANPDVYERAEKTEAVHAAARMPGASPEDYAWQDEGPLGPIYTITLVRGVEEYEVLRRLGAAPEHIRLIDVDEYPDSSRTEIVTVRRAGDWTIVIEECGWLGVQREVIGELSRDGGEAVAVMRHDYAARHDFAYALDGELVTGFDPSRPEPAGAPHPTGSTGIFASSASTRPPTTGSTTPSRPSSRSPAESPASWSRPRTSSVPFSVPRSSAEAGSAASVSG